MCKDKGEGNNEDGALRTVSSSSSSCWHTIGCVRVRVKARVKGQPEGMQGRGWHRYQVGEDEGERGGGQGGGRGR